MKDIEENSLVSHPHLITFRYLEESTWLKNGQLWKSEGISFEYDK